MWIAAKHKAELMNKAEMGETEVSQAQQTMENRTSSDVNKMGSSIKIKADGMEQKYYKMTRNQLHYQRLKYGLDFILALAMLIIFALPMLLICILQKLSSPSEPIFFRQLRIGQNEKIFTITKFRTMKSTAPKYLSTGEFQDAKRYISPFGGFLRKTSLDEIPQLFQVLTGKMSLCGPRPLIQQEEKIHKLRKMMGVYQIRPGLTGWAQVNGRDLLSDEEKAAYDKEYLEKMGLAFDVKILLMTVGKVLGRDDIHDGARKEESTN